MANKQGSTQDKAAKLEELRKLAYKTRFPILKFAKINPYLRNVYYMGSEKLTGGIIPINCSMVAIESLERVILKWAETKTLSEDN